MTLFIYLQLLDLLTTFLFLMHGVREANPLVRASLQLAGGTLSGLILVKVLAIGVAAFAAVRRYGRALRVANLLFCCVIVWNLLALIASPT